MPERLNAFAHGQHRRRESHSNENDDDRGRRDRRRRMQHDAQRTVIGCGLNRMDVRNLDKGQQCEQDQAHYHLRIQVPMPSGLEPRSCQRGDTS